MLDKQIKETVQDITETVDKFNSKEQATRRAELDALTDTRLSKNIRPIALLWALTLLTIAMVLKSCGVSMDETVLDTIYWVNLIVLGFYFPGRSLEKWSSKRKK